ncbi:MAG: peroxiredoxin family protein [Phycisphaerales bacterium]
MRTGPLASAMIGALVLLLGAPPEVPAQSRAKEPPAPPDAKAVLRESRAAILQARSFVYNGSIGGYGSLASVYGVTTASVAVERMIAGSPVLARIAVRGQDRPVAGAPTLVEFVYDGTSMRWRTAEGQVASAKPGESHARLLARPEMRPVALDLVLDQPMTHLIDTATAALEGRKSIEGEECDAIALEFVPLGAEAGTAPIKARLYVSAADRLPRRMEYPVKPMSPAGAAPPPEGGIAVTLAQLQVNPAIEPATWRIAGPPAPPEPEPEPTPPPPPPIKPRATLIPSGQPAPDWLLKDGDAREVQLSDFAGKVVILVFWTASDPSGRGAMPLVQALHDKFKERGVEVVAVSTGESRDPVTGPAAYMKDNGLTLRLAVEGGDVARGYGVRIIPTLYIIGHAGKIAHTRVGLRPEDIERLERIIDQQLKATR